MKILSLGLDNSILDKTSPLAARAVKYGKLVEKYTVIVPGVRSANVSLSEKVDVYSAGGANKIARLIKIYNLAKKLLQEEKHDVVSVQDQYYLALIGWRLSKKFKVGLEIQVHGFEKYFGLRKIAAQLVLPRAQAVRCVSQRLKRQLISDFGVTEAKITVAPIFIDLEMLNKELRTKEGNSNFIFLTVGRLASVKNIGLQIEAMREVAKKHPNTELWIVGGGPERKNYELLIANYKLEKNIKMLGQQPNLEKYYSQADAFILTSDSEGWGLAVIEAASAGLPIVMTEVGCAGEVIRDGVSGLVIPVGDKQKVIEAMFIIIEDENLRKKLGANAKLAVSRLPNKEQTMQLVRDSWQQGVLR